jgi:hypothetical protein
MSEWFKVKYNSIKEYFSSQDTKQSLTVAISFTSDAFKVLVASLLCIFVPQQCDNIQSNKDIYIATYGNNTFANHLNGTTNLAHICSFNENFSDLIDYNTFVLAFNFITLGYFIYLYWIELGRERWMIDNLDYDKEKPDENILSLKETFPNVIEKLQEYNYKYMLAYKYLHILYIFNFLFSAILVIHYYYYDYRTASTLITNFILCSNKIRIGRTIAKESYEKEYAYSFYNNKNVSFNVIDPKYLKLDEKNEEKWLAETNLDKKGENVYKHITSIKKYINTL